MLASVEEFEYLSVLLFGELLVDLVLDTIENTHHTALLKIAKHVFIGTLLGRH